MKTIISPKYSVLQEFVNNLPTEFDKLKEYELLRDGRNRIVKCHVEGYSLVIKSYGKPSIINSLIYGKIRRSKAMRAYYNALRLLELGIGTPEPVAAVDMFRNGMLERSFFVSLCSELIPLPAKAPYCHKDFCDMLDHLAEFIMRMHDCGVMHNDLNPSNILYGMSEDGGYEFHLVDNNRIRFKKALSMRDRLNDLRHFSSDDMPYLCMLHRYATLANREQRDAIELRGVAARFVLLKQHNMKMLLKSKLR